MPLSLHVPAMFDLWPRLAHEIEDALTRAKFVDVVSRMQSNPRLREAAMLYSTKVKAENVVKNEYIYAFSSVYFLGRPQASLPSTPLS